jgi:16S rRNA processing protein RimM
LWSSGARTTAEEFITIARVAKTQGRHGEVAVELHSDPARFHAGLRVFALGLDGQRRELGINDLWPHKGGLVLKFGGVDSISEAEPLAGCELQVPLSERVELEAGWAFTSDLIGCLVFDGQREIGKVEDVQFGAGEAPLLIVKTGAKQHEIPYAEAYLQSVDFERKQIRMRLPEGLLELDAPLTAEEKQQQRKK